MKKQSVKQRQVAILKKSVKWWNWYRKITNYKRINLSGSDLFGSDLSGSDLSGSNLSGSNLFGSNLSGSDLSGSNIDYSCIPFACKTLKTKFGQKHIIQILYHAAKPCQYYPEIVQDEDLKELLNSDLFKKVANKFHRGGECGRL